MPRVAGSKSSRKRISAEHALISTFNFQWEERLVNKPCCIEDCDHRCGDACAQHAIGFIVDERLMPGPKPDPFVGYACPHCVAAILARDA